MPHSLRTVGRTQKNKFASATVYPVDAGVMLPSTAKRSSIMSHKQTGGWTTGHSIYSLFHFACPIPLDVHELEGKKQSGTVAVTMAQKERLF